MWHGPLRTTTPQTRINDDLVLNHHHWEILIKNQTDFIGKNYQSELITKIVNIGEDFSVDFFKHCFVYIITETVADYPYPYFTEKTWKAIVSKMPFIFIGASNSIEQLHKFGFKTFSQWWNEEYDKLPTAAQRIESAIIELKKLSNLSQQELIEMRKEMESVVSHNHQHLTSFIDSDLDHIRKNL